MKKGDLVYVIKSVSPDWNGQLAIIHDLCTNLGTNKPEAHLVLIHDQEKERMFYLDALIVAGPIARLLYV